MKGDTIGVFLSLHPSTHNIQQSGISIYDPYKCSYIYSIITSIGSNYVRFIFCRTANREYADLTTLIEKINNLLRQKTIIYIQK